MKINKAGLKIIKDFECFRAEPYKCPAGVLTIGYGTTGEGVALGMKITELEAEKMLLKHLEKVERQIAALVAPKLTENEFSALCALIYNIGAGNFKNSTLLKLLNNNVDRKIVAQEFLRWTKAGGKELEGLKKRRKVEMELFLLK